MATPTIEEYLEAIYVMESEAPPVISARVAESVGVSAPTMADTLKRMIQQGYVTTGEGKTIRLTDAGRRLAEATVRRHRLSERWLVDVLGMDWARVHEEACRLEHALSPEVEARLARVLNDPRTCPHGNPIPGSGGPPEGVAVTDVAPGAEVILLRISPEAERNPRLLEHLQRRGLVPGAHLTVVEVATWAGTVTLAVGEATATVGLEVASHLRVRTAA